ncbi:hypothetical protein PG987_007539 [Apiospora arundinis]
MPSKRAAPSPPGTRSSKRSRPEPASVEDDELDYGDDPLEDEEDHEAERHSIHEGESDQGSSHRGDGGARDDDDYEEEEAGDDDDDDDDDESKNPNRGGHRRRRRAAGSEDPFPGDSSDDGASDSGISDGRLSRNSPVRSDDEKGLPLNKNSDAIDDAIENELVHYKTAAKKSAVKKEMLRFLRRMRRNDEEHRAWVDRHARMSKEQVLAPLEPAFTDEWTEDDEASLVREVRQDRYYHWLRTQLRLPKGKNNYFEPMWQKTLGLRRCRPTDIIGANNYLQYAATPGKTLGGRTYPEPIWTGKFCQRLVRLVVCFPGDDVQMVALFLRWAVACRINDRRRMPLLVESTAEGFFLELERQIKECDGRKSLPRIHHDVRQTFRDDETKLPWYSDVLRNIEKLLYSKDTPKTRGPVGCRWEDFAPYQVTTEDLGAVIRAFDSVRKQGIAVFANSGDTAKVVGDHRKFAGIWHPKTPKEFQEVLCKVYLSEQRLLLQRHRSAERDQRRSERHAPESDQNDAEALGFPEEERSMAGEEKVEEEEEQVVDDEMPQPRDDSHNFSDPEMDVEPQVAGGVKDAALVVAAAAPAAVVAPASAPGSAPAPTPAPAPADAPEDDALAQPRDFPDQHITWANVGNRTNKQRHVHPETQHLHLPAEGMRLEDHDVASLSAMTGNLHLVPPRAVRSGDNLCREHGAL